MITVKEIKKEDNHYKQAGRIGWHPLLCIKSYTDEGIIAKGLLYEGNHKYCDLEFYKPVIILENGVECDVEDIPALIEDFNKLVLRRDEEDKNPVDYKKAYELAMEYIRKSPCDPDIYPDQLIAYEALISFKKENNLIKE